jgi:hypothetical protein
MDYLYKAIRSLRPTSQFSYDNDDYSTIVWTVLDGVAPTLAEIEAEIVELKAAELQAEADKAAARTVALAKLAELGLTVADLEALGL